MEEICLHTATLRLIWFLFEFCNRQIGKQNLTLLGRFAADFLGYIANCQIDRIASFTLEMSELGLVCGNDNRNNGDIFIPILLHFLLINKLVDDSQNRV